MLGENLDVLSIEIEREAAVAGCHLDRLAGDCDRRFSDRGMANALEGVIKRVALVIGVEWDFELFPEGATSAVKARHDVDKVRGVMEERRDQINQNAQGEQEVVLRSYFAVVAVDNLARIERDFFENPLSFKLEVEFDSTVGVEVNYFERDVTVMATPGAAEDLDHHVPESGRNGEHVRSGPGGEVLVDGAPCGDDGAINRHGRGRVEEGIH